MNRSKKFACVGHECVACGSCIAVCPKKAITIPKGIRARIDQEACVGCGRCANICPAAVITIEKREGGL